MMVFESIGTFGAITAVVGYITVFTALVLLYLIFYNIPKLYKIKLRKNMKKKGKHTGTEGECCEDISGQTSAAIATALHMYFNEMHDHEDMVMTIVKVSKRYSPWSSKIYGLNNVNIRNKR